MGVLIDLDDRQLLSAAKLLVQQQQVLVEIEKKWEADGAVMVGFSCPLTSLTYIQHQSCQRFQSLSI